MAQVAVPAIHSGPERKMAPSRLTAENDPELFSVKETALAIAALGRARVVAISPGGDEGSAVSWQVARLLAGAGNSVLIVDLTGSAVTSRECLGTDNLAGLSELMARTATLSRTIYADRNSPAHVIPSGLGTDAGLNAMRELSALSGKLAQQYEFVVFDCGFVAAEGLEHIADAETIIIVNANGATRAETTATQAALRAAGYGDAVTVRLSEEVEYRRSVA
jgi:Mrp family chromosome partitioning ATPase